MYRSIALLVAMAAAFSAYADVLHIDLNEGAQEIAATKQALRRRGEKIALFPEIDKNTRKTIDALRASNQNLADQFTRSQNSDERERIRTEYRRANEEIQRLSENQFVNPSTLEKKFKELADSKRKITGIVVSGHDGNADFFGLQGRIHSSQLCDVAKKFPDVANQVKSLFLAGCYSVRAGDIEEKWKSCFPNIEVVGGYEHSAPSNKQDSNAKFLRKFLEMGHKLKDRSVGGLKAIARSMIPAEQEGNAALCLPAGRMAYRSSLVDFSELQKKCAELSAKGEAVNKVTQCYMLARPTCEDPPQDTHHSPLRDAYNLTQDFQVCLKLPSFQFSNMGSPEYLVRLIFYRNVVNNFYNQNIHEIEDSIAYLKRAGIDPDVAEKLKSLKSMSRAEILKWINDVSAKLDSIVETTEDKDTLKNALASRPLVQALMNHLGSYFSPSCIPFSWVDSGSNDHSRCLVKAYAIGQKAMEWAELTLPEKLIEKEQLRVARELDRMQRDGINNYDPWPPRDAVISETAIAKKINQLRTRALNLRSSLLQDEYNFARYSRFVKTGEDEYGAVNTSAYQREVDALAPRIEEMRKKISDLGPQLDLPTLKKDRKAYLQVALKGLEVDDETLKYKQEQIASLQGEIAKFQSANSTHTWDSNIRSNEKQIAIIQQSIEESKLQKEYIEKSLATLKDPSNTDAAKRVQEIVKDRIMAYNAKQIFNLSRIFLYLAVPTQPRSIELQGAGRRIDETVKHMQKLELDKTEYDF